MTTDVTIESTDVESSATSDTSRDRQDRLRTWNRKLHYYLGLYLLLFLWLFSVSGLILNHPKWATGQFWSERKETAAERPIRAPPVTSDAETAADLMRQLAIVGEVSDLQRDPTGASFNFQVVRPGQVFRIAADLSTGRAAVTEIELNAWGVMDALHKFTGVRMDRPNEERDWALTRLWSLSMDAVALGLVILIASGLYLWYRLRQKRIGGIIALTLGIACCGFFMYGSGLLM